VLVAAAVRGTAAARAGPSAAADLAGDREGQARHARACAAQRAEDLDAHFERRLYESLDLLAETWLPGTGGFVYDGQVARSWLRYAIAVIYSREPIAAADCIAVHVRSWKAARPRAPAALFEAVGGALRAVITEVDGAPPQLVEVARARAT
jgi:hypothetical protein